MNRSTMMTWRSAVRRWRRHALWLLAPQATACSDRGLLDPAVPQPIVVRSGVATWTGRDSFGIAVLPGGNSVLIYGGLTPDRSDETWISGDVGQWERVPRNTSVPSPRNGHCLISHLGRILVIGGFDGSSYLADVYSSPDGRSWTRLGNAPFSPRAFFGCVSLNGDLFVFGGNGAAASAANDVWRTVDGSMWELVSEHAPWSARGMFAAVVARGRMWVIGGGVYDARYLVNVSSNQGDAWSSADGINWEPVPMPQRFTPRRFMRVAVVSGTTFLVGGFELDRRRFQDQRTGILRDSPAVPEQFHMDPLKAGREFGNLPEIWASTDMRHWYQVATPPEFSPRHAPGVVAFGNRAWILGGFGSDLFNDVWTITLAPGRAW